MTKDQFMTEIIRGLQANEKVKEALVLWNGGQALAELHNGDKFVITITKKQRR